MLMRPNKAETNVYGYHCLGDMAVRMRKVPGWCSSHSRPRALVFYHVTDGDKRKREQLWGREWCSSVSFAFIYFCFVFVFLFLFCQKEQRYYRSEKIAHSYSFVGSYISPQIIVTQ